MSCQRILILGGYGNFGKRITETLADTADITLIITGRRNAPAQRLQAQLQNTARARLETAESWICTPPSLRPSWQRSNPT
ncbi:KR domain-containing protein [Halopseudomonas pachastrellae]|nr:KR domain-containing protein [Halopseudomonas pachastrellae]